MRTTSVAVAVVAWAVLVPASDRAQQAARIPRIGYVSPVRPEAGARTTNAFREGLAALGWVDGKTITIDARFAGGKFDQVPELIRELVASKVDAIAILGAVTVRAAQKAAGDVPLVFAVVVDPVAVDLVRDADHPGANVTGVTTYDPEQPRKQLELLREIVPRLRRVAFIGDQSVPDALMTASERAARVLGIESRRVRLSGPDANLEKAFETIRQGRADAVVALEEPAVATNASRIAALANRYRLPSVFTPLRPDEGFLVAYGTSVLDGMRAMAPYLDKILQGAKPGDLPVGTVRNYSLTVNLATARALGIAVPRAVLDRANHVIR